MKRPTILIVEDHDETRDMLCNWLMDTYPECKFMEACSGEEAMKKAYIFSPDLILMDIRLPRMNGLEATRKIRMLMPGMRVIILTSHDEMAYRLEADRAGASAFISKENFGSHLLPLMKNLLIERTFE